MVILNLSGEELKLLIQVMDVDNYHIPGPHRANFDLWSHLFCDKSVCPFYDQCEKGEPCDELFEKLKETKK